NWLPPANVGIGGCASPQPNFGKVASGKMARVMRAIVVRVVCLNVFADHYIVANCRSTAL
ncbi:MAG TPA: hypothetical protein VFP43_23875, partial [Mesorhizobium sp.]|nr:hypothetical protein [Mesorhizobium sp.]